MSGDALLTPSQAAALLGISVGAFHAWRRRNHIPNRLAAGRSVRVYESDLVVRRGPAVVDFAELGRQRAREAFRARG